MRGVLLDLDGVLYVGDEALPGAAETVARLTSERVPFRFLTNTTSRPRSAIVEKLGRMGITADARSILTPAVAAAAWLRRAGIERPALFVPDATAEDFDGFRPLAASADSGAGAVVLGDLGSGWDFATLNRAFRLLMADPGIPLIALGLTRYWRADDGLRLDVGGYVRALEYATGRDALILGKPDAAFYRAAVEELGCRPDEAVMVGDDIRTDVAGAEGAGLVAVLVRTGKFAPSDLEGGIRPDAVLDSIADLPGWLAATPAADATTS